MKVTIELSNDIKVPYAVIYSDKMTDEIQHALDLLSSSDIPITAQHEDKLVILKPDEIYMVRIEAGNSVLYGFNKTFYSRKRLYELAEQLGTPFMQISKTTLVNLSYLDSVEAGFSGTMLLKLKNGCKDYVSRRYLPDFKKYLGL